MQRRPFQPVSPSFSPPPPSKRKCACLRSSRFWCRLPCQPRGPSRRLPPNRGRAGRTGPCRFLALARPEVGGRGVARRGLAVQKPHEVDPFQAGLLNLSGRVQVVGVPERAYLENGLGVRRRPARAGTANQAVPGLVKPRVVQVFEFPCEEPHHVVLRDAGLDAHREQQLAAARFKPAF